ncbi:hypothetical protein P4V47_19655 [Brevibacillus laterosporus]|uniref:hypothetical protein n=1 Tax=Brevibacillus laterosporus TaxID=1465 RepID=UPI001EF1FC2D|nr:hypothetical protein [Brevibacillus laterosporus]MCG7320172.1 hypothetical protein [Brevibacillus laterosporus]MED1789664.1 hypothetical protein [Brevibacillus laterosporus]
MSFGPCDYYNDNHRMYTQGFCHIRDKKTGESLGRSWAYYKCKCGEYFACEGYPFNGGPIGEYIVGDYLSGSGQSGIYVFEVNSRDISYTSKSTLAGYRFYSK